MLALTMTDQLQKQRQKIRPKALEKAFGARVVELAVPKGIGKAELLAAIEDAPEATAGEAVATLRVPEKLAKIERDLSVDLSASVPQPSHAKNLAYARWLLLTHADDSPEHLPPRVQERIRQIHASYDAGGSTVAEDLIGARYERIDRLTEQALLLDGSAPPTRSGRLDAILTHPKLGPLIFVGIMFLLFQGLFMGAAPFMGVIENLISSVQAWTISVMADGPLRQLIVDGVIAGVGNVVIFVPQLAILFVALGCMEDSVTSHVFRSFSTGR